MVELNPPLLRLTPLVDRTEICQLERIKDGFDTERSGITEAGLALYG